jgi:hypothetical protein
MVVVKDIVVGFAEVEIDPGVEGLFSFVVRFFIRPR